MCINHVSVAQGCLRQGASLQPPELTLQLGRCSVQVLVVIQPHMLMDTESVIHHKVINIQPSRLRRTGDVVAPVL